MSRRSTYIAVRYMLKDGYDLNEIAKELQLTFRTILKYVGIIIFNGLDSNINIYDYIQKSKADVIFKVFQEIGIERLKPVMEELDQENIDYDDLELVRTLMFKECIRYNGKDTYFVSPDYYFPKKIS